MELLIKLVGAALIAVGVFALILGLVPLTVVLFVAAFILNLRVRAMVSERRHREVVEAMTIRHPH